MIDFHTWDSPRYPKLYVIGRADLAPGLMAAQVTHAAFQLALEHPQVVNAWDNQTLIILSVADEVVLLRLYEIIRNRIDLEYAVFFEPDLDDALTAIALAPSEAADRITANLPLALKGFHAGPLQRATQWWKSQNFPRHHASVALGSARRFLTRRSWGSIPRGRSTERVR